MKNNFFFKNLSSNIYKSPSRLSEITSQILYGEKFKVLSKKKEWIKIKTLFDNYIGYIKHIKKIKHKENNYIKILRLFIKTKYMWGGKTYKGIDCSAILQLFYYYNNRFYPRDTKDQIKYSKKNTRKKTFKKGDIIFWKGHVAICINSKKLIHAYGPEKKVLIMPIQKTIKKIKETARLIIKSTSSIIHF